MPEVSLSSSQISALDRLANTFLTKVEGKRKGNELEARRERLGAALQLCLTKLTIAGHQVGGLVENTLDTAFNTLSGNDLVFNLKRIAFPEGHDYDTYIESIEKKGTDDSKLEVGQIVIGYTRSFEITSIEEGVVKGKTVSIESRKKREYLSANVPEFIVTTSEDIVDVTQEIKRCPFAFNDLNELKAFLFELDIQRYRVYREMCEYLVNSLITKLHVKE